MPFKTPHPVFQTTDTFQQLIDDLNTYGNTVDSDLGYVDSAIGPDAGSGFYLNGLLTTSGNLIDAINELDSDLHGVGGGTYKTLTTTEAKTVVGSINEIEAVFDASASTIDTTAGLTVTSAGTETHNITGSFNVNASGSMDLDAGGDITLDADGNDIIFKNGPGTRLQYSMGATNTVTSTGNYTVDASGDITLDADGNDIFFNDGAATRLRYTLGATNTVASTGNYTVDASGDITLDADGNDIIFKNGADGDTVYHRLYASQQYHIEAPAGIKLTSNGDEVIIEGSSTSSARATFSMDTTPTVTFTGSTNLVNTSGSFTIDAAQYAILDATLGRVYFQYAGVNKITHFLDASTITAEIAGGYTVDATGDITLDADGGDVVLKDGGTTAYNFSSGGTIARTGDITLDVSGDINLDADGQHIRFKDAGTTRVTHTLGSTNTVSSVGAYTVDATGDITLDADGNDIMFRDGASQRVKFSLAATNTVAYTGNLTETATGAYSQTATSYSSNVGTGVYNTTSGNQTHTVGGTHQINATGTISHTSGGAFNITANGGNATIDASGDVILDADGNDIIFKNGAGGDQVKHALADNGEYVITYPSTVRHTQSAGDLIFNVAGDDVVYTDGTTERFRLNLDASPNLYMTGASASISNSAGRLLIDAVGEVELDAGSGSVNFDQNGVQYAAIDKSGSNVIFRLASNAIGFTVNTTNLTVPGEITLPSSGTGTITSSEISANTVHGAIDEVNARIPNVYNRAGTLMNP